MRHGHCHERFSIMKTNFKIASGVAGWKALIALMIVGTARITLSAPSTLLWQIGKPDNDNREFALAPNRYTEFHEDGFFVVGRSDPKRDWPYVHPGPNDAWAGGRQHTFAIVFGLKNPIKDGGCKLRFDLIDTQHGTPPELRIEVNGKAFTRSLPPGADDASVFGRPAKGKECRFDVPFPAALLKAGANQITITTLSGSWLLYDSLGLEAPSGAEMADVTGTVVSSMRSPPVLIERGGKLFKTVQVSIGHFGEETNALIRVNGVKTTNLTLRSTIQSFEIAVAAVEKEAPIIVSVEVADKVLAAETLSLKPVRKWVVYLLPHSHVDIGYTHVQTDVERAQWRYIDMAIDTAPKTASNPPGARFKWN